MITDLESLDEKTKRNVYNKEVRIYGVYINTSDSRVTNVTKFEGLLFLRAIFFPRSKTSAVMS